MRNSNTLFAWGSSYLKQHSTNVIVLCGFFSSCINQVVESMRTNHDATFSGLLQHIQSPVYHFGSFISPIIIGFFAHKSTTRMGRAVNIVFLRSLYQAKDIKIENQGYQQYFNFAIGLTFMLSTTLAISMIGSAFSTYMGANYIFGMTTAENLFISPFFYNNAIASGLSTIFYCSLSNRLLDIGCFHGCKLPSIDVKEENMESEIENRYKEENQEKVEYSKNVAGTACALLSPAVIVLVLEFCKDFICSAALSRA